MEEKIIKWQANGATEAEISIYVFEKDAKFRAVKGTKGGMIIYLLPHFLEL